MDIPEKRISVINEAGLQISRLSNIWVDCRINRERGSLEKYKWVLDSAEVELWDDAEELKMEKEIERVNGNINKCFKNSKIISSKRGLLYLKLVEKEKLLRKIQNKSGKGSKYKDWDEDEMD